MRRHGTSASPRSLAASTRTGFVKPKRSIDAAICRTCFLEWVRALRFQGWSSVGGCHSTCDAAMPFGVRVEECFIGPPDHCSPLPLCNCNVHDRKGLAEMLMNGDK